MDTKRERRMSDRSGSPDRSANVFVRARSPPSQNQADRDTQARDRWDSYGQGSAVIHATHSQTGESSAGIPGKGHGIAPATNWKKTQAFDHLNIGHGIYIGDAKLQWSVKT